MHQPFNRSFPFQSISKQKRKDHQSRHRTFLRLFTDIHLHKNAGNFWLLLTFFHQSINQFRAINRLNHIKQSNRLFSFIGLAIHRLSREAPIGKMLYAARSNDFQLFARSFTRKPSAPDLKLVSMVYQVDFRHSSQLH